MKELGNYEKITIGDLPSSKLMKAIKTGKMSLSKSDLDGNDFTMLVHPSTAKMIKKAKMKGTGIKSMPVSRGEVEYDIAYHDMSGSGLSGGSIWKKIWSGIKSAWNPIIKPALSAALDAAAPALGAYTGQPALVSAARKGLKDLTGVGMAERMQRVRAAKKSKSNKINVLTAGSFRIN